MRVEFGLRKGMTPKEIYAELKGRVSGETRQEMQLFYAVAADSRTFDDSGSLKLEPIHEVVLADSEYALILKRENHGQLSGGPGLAQRAWYLCGVNDETKYFVHRMEGFPLEVAAMTGTLTMEQVLNWVNRAEEGFTMRVQGDILIQFMPASYFASKDPKGYSNEYEFRSDVSGALPRVRFDSLRAAGKRALLGNHTVTTDGTILSSWSGMTVVIGEQVTLQHPEHGIKTVDIPKAHAAILAGQNGRFGQAAFD